MAERKIDMNAHIAGVTECPICMDKMDNNRMLPCGHTFCLKCLEQYNRTIKSKGKSLACHVCRKEFSIPVGGCSMFPKNAMVDKILGIESKQGRNESDTEQCVLCVKGKKAIATVHCIQCDQSLCGDCKRTHSKLKTCLTHHIIPLSKTSHLGDYTSKSYCDNHPNHVLELMCSDCNKPICSKCRFLTHKSHTLADVGELVDSYSEQLQSNIEEIGQRLSIMDKLSEDIKDQEKQTQENFDREKERVSKTAKDLIRCIVANEDKLLEQLSISLQRNLKALQPYKLQFESQSDLLRQHKNSVEHLKGSGNIWEILRNAGEFHKTASELMSSDLITINKNKLALPSLTELQIQSHLIGTNSIYEDSTLSRLPPGCPSAASAAESAEEPLEDLSDHNASADEYKKSFQAEEEMAMKNRVKKRPVALPKKAQLQAGCQKQSDTDVMRQKPTAVGSSVLEHACSLESTRDSLSNEDYIGLRAAGSSVLEHACSSENTRDSLSSEDYLGLRAADTITSTVCPSEIYMNTHFQSQIGQDCEENQYETVSEFIANWKSSSSPLKGSSGSPILESSSAVIDSENRKWPPAESNDRTAYPINATKNAFQAGLHEELEVAMKNRVKKRHAALPKKAQLQACCQKQSDTDVMKQQPTVTAIATGSRALHRVRSLETTDGESSVSLSDVYANAHLQTQSQQDGYANLSDVVRDVKINWSGSLPSRKGH